MLYRTCTYKCIVSRSYNTVAQLMLKAEGFEFRKCFALNDKLNE